MLNNTQKYVASRTLAEPLPWRNSTLLGGDATEGVAKLKEEPGKDIAVLGSGELVQSLMRHNLAGEYTLLIHPLVLGSGRRLFADGKGHLGGFTIIRAPDLDAALEWGRKLARATTLPIEVRPFQDRPGTDA